MSAKQTQVEGYERELRALWLEFDADADQVDAMTVDADCKVMAGRILRDEFNVAQMVLAIEWGFYV